MYLSSSPNRGRHAALVTVLCGIVLALAPPAAPAAQSVTLGWNPSPGTNIVGYNIYYGVASGVYTNVVPVGNVTNGVVNNLVSGATYYFAATSLSSLGLESVYSTEISYAVPLPNQPPTLNTLPNITVIQNAGVQTVALSGISSGSTNQGQTLVVTATSSNTGLIPTPTVSYTSPSTTGSISFTPVSGGFGTSTITVTVNNGGLSNNIISRAFTVTVDAVPTISPVANLTIAYNTTTPVIPFTIADADTSVTNLVVTAHSSNQLLVADAGIVLGGTGANRNVTITPLANQVGVAGITLSVSDGFATNSTSFQLTVQGRPTAPSNFRVVAGG
jgi:hypothetical protein